MKSINLLFAVIFFINGLNMNEIRFLEEEDEGGE